MKKLKEAMIGTGAVLLLLVGMVGILTYFYSEMEAQSKNEEPGYWEKNIGAIESRYGNDYPQNAVIFYGSSSIRKWETLAEDMAPLRVINHGFGGSKVADAIYYVDRMVLPFNPKAVVLFIGANDINGVEGNSKSGEEVYERVVTLFNSIHTQKPEVPIYYISISPTNARWKVWQEAHTANQLIADYAKANDRITFIDMTDKLLDSQGKPNSDLFIEDGIHLNEKGYHVWTSLIAPILETDLIQQQETVIK